MTKLNRQSAENKEKKRFNKNLFAPLRLCIFALCFFFSACVPATVPPQLAYTPGPPVVIAGQVYHSAAFTVSYPPGWEAITSAATSPPTVIFLAPEGDALIMVGVEVENVPPLEGAEVAERREVTLADATVTAVLQAPAGSQDRLLPIFEAVVKSVKQTQG